MNKRTMSMAAAGLAAVLLISSAVSASAADAAGSLISKKPLEEIRTWAGSGEFAYRDAAGALAAFHNPTSLLYNPAGGTYVVADTRNQRIRVIAQDGNTSTVAGYDWEIDELNTPAGGMNDGAKEQSILNSPGGLAADSKGNIYIADSRNNAIRVLDTAGKLSTFAGNGIIGNTDGAALSARFYHPLDVAVSPSGTVYVADTLNHVIRKIESGTVTTIGAPSNRTVTNAEETEFLGDYADGTLATAKFNEPSGLALDSKGNLFVSDTGNQRIRYIDFDKGTVATVAGGESGGTAVYSTGEPFVQGDFSDGAAAQARFNAPRGLAVTPEGGLLIADSLNHAIRYLKDGKVSTLAGTPGDTGRADGIASAAGFNKPTDVAWIGGDSFAVADAGNNRIRIVKPYSVPAGVKPGAAIHLLLDNQKLESDVPPVIIKGTTYVPVRVLTEKLGYQVSYKNGMVVLSQAGVTYMMKAGSAQITITTKAGTEESLKLDAAPLSMKNRLFVPVRFFAEQAALDVQWLAEYDAVLLRHKQFTA